MKQVILNIPDSKFDFFMELFQNLGLKTTSEFNFHSMSEKQIIEQAKIAEKQIIAGKTTPHDDVYEEFKKW